MPPIEEQSRILSRKVFAMENVQEMSVLEQVLSEKEQEMLLYYLTSGVHGTREREVDNRIQRYKDENGIYFKFSYYWSRLFPDEDTLESYSFFTKYKRLKPMAYAHRIMLLVFDKRRRKKIIDEIKLISKSKYEK